MKYLAGFIGSGNMGSALAIAAAKSVNPKEIAVSDHSMKKAEALAENIGAVAVDNAEIVDCNHLDRADLIKWLNSYLAKSNTKIEKGAFRNMKALEMALKEVTKV